MPQERTNIYAFTEPTPGYPAYVSVNAEEDGKISITVRSQGDGGTKVGTIELGYVAARAMAEAILHEGLGIAGAGG